MDEILNKLKEIFIVCLNNEDIIKDVNYDTLLKEDLSLDSLGLILLAASIEMQYNIDMGEVSSNTFKTVGDVCSYIKERL